ncbi:MAG: hypothetical protein ACTSRP_06365 [Candidatus Helarchaeota archaeon]
MSGSNSYRELEYFLENTQFYKNIILKWIINQRWSGLKDKNINSISIIDKFIIKISSNEFLVFLNIGIETDLGTDNINKNSRIEFFIPFLFSTTKNEFSISELEKMGKKFYFSYANHHIKYYNRLLDYLISSKEFVSIRNLRLCFNLIDKNFASSEAENFKIMGGGDTTNSVIMLKLKNYPPVILKEYRVLKKQREVSILKFLNDINYPYSPKIIGTINYRRLKTDNTVGIIIEYIKSIGDGGILFWKNLTEKLELIYNKKLQISNTNEFEELLINDAKLAIIIKNLVNTIVLFHNVMTKFDDKIEYYNEDDVNVFHRLTDEMVLKIHEKIQDLNDVRHKNLIKEVYSETFDKNSFIHKDFQWRHNLCGIMKIHCHQDLHFIQMLTHIKNGVPCFYIIDLEGDPQLSYEMKMRKDIVFRDIASLITALLYMKFSALKELYYKLFQGQRDLFKDYYFIKKLGNHNIENFESIHKIDPKIFQIMQFSDSWTRFVSDQIIKEYFNKYELKFKNKFPDISKSDIISKGMKLYILDRAVRELKYELQFRPENSMIPMLIIWEYANQKY